MVTFSLIVFHQEEFVPQFEIAQHFPLSLEPEISNFNYVKNTFTGAERGYLIHKGGFIFHTPRNKSI